MSDSDIRAAENELKDRVESLEQILDRLGSKIDLTTQSVQQLGDRVRDPGRIMEPFLERQLHEAEELFAREAKRIQANVSSSFKASLSSARAQFGEFIGTLGETTSEQLDRIDRKPLTYGLGFFAIGVLAGAWIARNRSDLGQKRTAA